MNKKPFLIILRGVSGAGKSTFAKLIQSISTEEIIHLEADFLFYDKHGNYNFNPNLRDVAHNKCFKGAISAFSDKKNVIVSNTFTQEWEFTMYEKTAKEMGYDVYSLVVEKRHNGISDKDVPDKVRENQFEKLMKNLSLK